MDVFVVPGAAKEIEDAFGEPYGSPFLPSCINKEAERRESFPVDPLWRRRSAPAPRPVPGIHGPAFSK